MRIDAALAALAGLLIAAPVATPALAQVPAELIDKIAAIGRDTLLTDQILAFIKTGK